MNQHDETIREIVPDLEYRAEFIPQSKSRNAGEQRPTLNWRVTFSRAGRTLTTDYSAGIAHLPGYVHKMRRTVADAEYEKRCAESGLCAREFESQGLRKIPAPAASDVLHCLLMDAEALDASGFEEWADNLGYDSDSRAAERTYRACLETGLQLRAMIGDELTGRLREALADL